MRFRRSLLIALAAALLVVLATPAYARAGARATAGAAPYRPRFQSSACPPVVAQEPGVRCGYVVVPEDRARPSGRQVRLAVAVLPPIGAAWGTRAPVVYVNGGPGYGTFSIAEFYRSSQLRRTRPIILSTSVVPAFRSRPLRAPRRGR